MQPPGHDDTAERILDAAIESASIHGITRTSMSDVASRAGISRPTLYTRFASKDALVAEVVRRETDRMIAEILLAAADHEDTADALEAAILVTLRVTREHPLLDRIVRTEPETLVPLLVADPSPVLAWGRAAVTEVIASREPHLTDLEVRRIGDVLLRLLVSYALTPPDDPPEVVARSIAALLTDGQGAVRQLSDPDPAEDPR